MLWILAEAQIARARLLLRFLIEKITLRYAIEDAHRNGAKPAALRSLAARFRKQADLLDRIAGLWRAYWLARFRPNGLEVIQNRLAAGAARQRETALRLEEWAAGKAAGLPELDAPDVRCDRWLSFSWKRNSSSSLDV